MTRIIFALLWAAHFLPDRALAAIGNGVGALLFWLIPERRHVTRINLAKCFPQMPAGEREALARAHFRAFARSFVDRSVLWWAPRARVEALLWAGADRCVAPAGSAAFAAAAPPGVVEHQVFPALAHEIFNEPERAQVLQRLLGWRGLH